jgi:Arc/MetJ-type ribon-helix-helix transcriptional regulator
MFDFRMVSEEELRRVEEEARAEQHVIDEEDEAVQAAIRALPSSMNAEGEKNVVSFGLYGSNPEYVHGALRNAELAKLYFPGWWCR